MRTICKIQILKEHRASLYLEFLESKSVSLETVFTIKNWHSIKRALDELKKDFPFSCPIIEEIFTFNPNLETSNELILKEGFFELLDGQLDEIKKMLRLYNLPDSTNYSASELSDICLSDKKRAGDSLTMIFPVEIGKCILKEVPVNELQSILELGA